jgi:uncharacterized membrane protein
MAFKKKVRILHLPQYLLSFIIKGGFDMSISTRSLKMLFIAILGFVSFNVNASAPSDSVKLYTPYLKISVAPGEAVDYSVDLINNSAVIRDAEITVSGIPASWNHSVKSGGFNVREISVLPGDKKSFTLRVEVPLKVNRGSYRFQVKAGDLDVLPLTLIVASQGTYKTEFTTRQANMQGTSTSTFNFQTIINNLTADNQHYALTASYPPGWVVTFKPNYQQATSVDVLANGKVDMGIDVNPPDNTKAGTYNIKAMVATSASTASIDLEVVITGTYGLNLTTPTGLLSTSITAGETKRLDLLVRNTGSIDLLNVKLESGTPINWELAFEPSEIDRIAPENRCRSRLPLKHTKRPLLAIMLQPWMHRQRKLPAKCPSGLPLRLQCSGDG